MARHYVLITGGRDYADQATVDEIVDFLHAFYGEDLRILHGAARGADSLAQKAIERLGIAHKKFPADWKTHPKAGGVIRNAEMARYLDFCRDSGHSTQIVAFPGGNGTNNMIQEGSRRNHHVDPIGWEP